MVPASPRKKIKDLVQPDFQRYLVQGRFYLNISRKMNAWRPKVFQQAMSAPASEHSKWGNIPGLAEKICGPCSEGQLSLGKTCRKEHFPPPPLYLLVWVAGGLPLFNDLCVRQCQHSWYMNGFCKTLPWMRPQERYSSRRKRDNLCVLPGFMHLISQANMDTWRLSNQN